MFISLLLQPLLLQEVEGGEVEIKAAHEVQSLWLLYCGSREYFIT